MLSGWARRCAVSCAAWAATLPPATPARGADQPPAADPPAVLPVDAAANADATAAAEANANAEPGIGPASVPAGVVAAARPVPAARAGGRRPPRWVDVCQLSVVDGRLSLRSDLTLEMIRGLEPDMRLADMPGDTTVVVRSRRFAVQNVRATGDEVVSIGIESGRGELRVEMSATTADGRGRGVVFTQSNTDFGRRLGRGGDTRLATFGHAGATAVVADANDLAGLRRDAPHAVNRHLRPLLRRFGPDPFQVDPAAARQVLLGGDGEGGGRDGGGETTTRPAAADRAATEGRRAGGPGDGAVTDTVRRLVAELDAPAYARRSAAADRLARLGPPGLAAVGRLDRSRLSPQQNLALDLLLAASRPLSDDEARRLRADPHFLLDCLYAPDDDIRSAAADRLGRLTRAGAERFAEPLALHPTADADKLGEAIERLRDELAPPTPGK